MKICSERIQCTAKRIATLLGFALLLTAIAPVSAKADEFVGAVWSFQLTPHNHSLTPLKGRFRISDRVMFQRENPYDCEMTRLVGNNYPSRNQTQFEVSGLRVFSLQGRLVGQRKGVGKATFVSYGEWEGSFVDGRGRTYDFKCSRILE